MIKSIRLQNFFGFQDCTINLEKGENVLVGINGSGKSNFFKAISLLQNGFYNESLSDLIIDTWGGRNKTLFVDGEQRNFKILYTFDVKAFQAKTNRVSSDCDVIELFVECKFVGSTDYAMSISIDAWKNNKKRAVYKQNGRKGTLFYHGEGEGRTIVDIPENDDFFIPGSPYNSEIDFLIGFCLDVKSYTRLDTSDNGTIRAAKAVRASSALNQDGSNLTRLLHTFKLNNKRVFKAIVSSLNKVNNNFSDIDFNVFSNQIELLIEETPFNKSIPISNISDGTLRFLCLMSIFLNPKRGSLICIDEPELGLHPDMISTLSEAIQFAAQTSQIIISTHSPELLNHFNVENIRVFEKDENNAKIVNQYEVEQFDDFMNKYMPGQLWRQGHLGGNRW